MSNVKIPAGATHKFRGDWFKEDSGCWTTYVSGVWALVDRSSFDLLNRQAAPITDHMRRLSEAAE